MLAALLLHANEVVPSERLWSNFGARNSPLSAANALNEAISWLRKVLPPVRLITMGPGYLLRIFAAVPDVAQFEQLIFEGGPRRGAAEEAVQLLDQAMTQRPTDRSP